MQLNLQKSQQNTNIELLAQEAIAAALASDWPEAAKINKKILTSQKDNVEALNRLARSYTCLNQQSRAEKTYKKTLEIDPYNIIALKNLEKIKKGNNHGASLTNGNDHSILNNNFNLSSVFLYEPGKIKIVNLINLAPPQVLATVNCGDQLILNPKNHAITISMANNTYLGAFPDDLAHRLISLIAGGNKYEAFAKCVTTKILTIFVKETYRSEKFANQPSFATKNTSYFDEDSTSW